MSAQRIRLIIILMSIALIGSIGLQAFWITWNIRLNEEQFDKNVRDVLIRVADKLQYYDELSNYQEVQEELPDEVMQGNGFKQMAEGGAGSFQHEVTRWEMRKVNQLLDAKPLAERIKLDLLSQSMREEIESRGIRSQYQFGVYSKAKNSFVVVNDHYVVTDDSPQITHGGASSLYNSPYRVSLFQQDLESPGYLAIYFPNRTSLVLGSVWKTLLLSVAFTGIILFCFWYTIRIIYRQKKLSEMKTDFINNMTHEFKTPIATISLASDNIINPIVLNNPEKIKRFVDIIRQENRRMNSQVERVLQMALIDKKDFQLNLDDLNLHEVIRQAVDNFSLQVEKREGVLSLDLQSTRPVIQGDATHIASIIHNLLDNANKYSPEKPDITIRTRDVAIGVEVSVEDKGIGINKEARKLIFDKFYRVPTGNIHDVKGFGLGLSYVKVIMTAHKGLVDVKSEPGKGSAFMLTFPSTQ